MHLQGLIRRQNEPITILVDSGASHSCVSGGLVEKLIRKGCLNVSDVKPVQGKLVVAGIFDEPLQIKEYVNFSIFVNDSDDNL